LTIMNTDLDTRGLVCSIKLLNLDDFFRTHLETYAYVLRGHTPLSSAALVLRRIDRNIRLPRFWRRWYSLPLDDGTLFPRSSASRTNDLVLSREGSLLPWPIALHDLAISLILFSAHTLVFKERSMRFCFFSS